MRARGYYAGTALARKTITQRCTCKVACRAARFAHEKITGCDIPIMFRSNGKHAVLRPLGNRAQAQGHGVKAGAAHGRKLLTDK